MATWLCWDQHAELIQINAPSFSRRDNPG